MASNQIQNIYETSINNVQGKPINFQEFKGKVLLVFNSASKCGFTGQLEGLQKLSEKYKEKGLVVIGCPARDFNQEFGQDSEVESFCMRNYGVTFTMTETINVNGDKEHPLFNFLKRERPGILGLKMIKWNFEKFLVDKNGNVVSRFATPTTPSSISPDIEKLL